MLPDFRRGGFWYHYDEAHYDELAQRYAEDVHNVTRSDSGASPFEELMLPEPHSRDVVEWLSDHRKRSPYPVRHHATNVHRTGTAARSPARGVSTAPALSTLDQMPEGYEVGL